MLKHNYAINLAAASLLVVPAVTLQSGTSASLADALHQTVEAIEAVAGIEQRVQNGNPEAVKEIVRFTEDAITNEDDPGAADRLLEALRVEVAQLQVEVDETQRTQLGSDLPSVETLLADEPSVSLPASTTGLNDNLRNMLAKGPTTMRAIRDASRPEPEQPVAPKEAEPVKAQTVTLEAEGYAADPLRLGRALYQKGRYQDALDVLSHASTEIEARYWKARSLEKLGRFGEALDEFAQVASSEDGGHFVDRAREDIEFLRWRMAFQGKDKSKGSK